MVIAFFLGLIGHAPVKFQTMLVIAQGEVDLLDSDRFHPFRISGSLINLIEMLFRFAFFPQAKGKFETAGRCPSILIRPPIVKPAEAGALFVNDKELPLWTALLRIDSLIDGMGLTGR